MDFNADVLVSTWLAERYSLERGIAANTEYQMRVSVSTFDKWLGRPAKLTDLTEYQVSTWLRDMEKSETLSKRTISGRRGDLLAIWRHAADCGVVQWPQRVRSIKVPQPMPVAWTLEEIGALLRHAETLGGFLSNGLPRRRYFWTLLKSAYETGFRRSDLLRFHISWMRDDGTIVMTQHKTGFAHVAAVRQDTRDALVWLSERKRADGQDRPEQPLWWPYTPRQMYLYIEQIVAAAGVRPGALQQFRRTGATHSERVQPGAAIRYLGHASHSQAQKHYVDRSLAYGPTIPPEGRTA